MSFEITINESIKHTFSKEELRNAHIIENPDGTINLIYKNKSVNVEIVSISEDAKNAQLKIDNQIYHYEIKTPLDLVVDKMGFSTEDVEDQKELKSPMPGIILDLSVKVGMEVDLESPLLILEAMKMENIIKAKSKQIVKEIHVEIGQAVNKNDLLITFE